VQTKNVVNPHYAFVGGVFGTEAILFASAVLGGRALYDQAALAETIAANVDFQRIKTRVSQTLLIYNTVDLQSGELVTFNNRDHTPRQLADALLASASMPVLMDPVAITVEGWTSQYVDGGVREFLPLRAVFDSGIELDHVVAISTAPFEPKRQPASFDAITQILVRTIDILDSEVSRDDYSGALLFNSLLQMIENAEAEGVPRAKLLRGVPDEIRRRLSGKRAIPVTFIGPARHIEMNSLEFEPVAMRALMKEGVRVAKQVVPKIAAQLEAHG
jgi:predicted acylesterase/phospholipase RssA